MKCITRIRVAWVLAPLAISACTVGPDYAVPSSPVSAAFKEMKGWKQAAPSDHLDRGTWWSVFKDPTLDDLLRRVEISNQTVAASAAAYDQAAALVREAQAGQFATISGSYSATRSGEGAAQTGTGHPTAKTTFTPSLSGSWDLDVWGKLRRQVESSTASAEVSAADLANAKLSAQAQLAIAYFNLQATDSLHDILTATVSDYRKTLAITENQFNVGTVSKADLVTAQTQLLTAQAQAIGVGVQRQQYEHAIAILTGRPPSDVTLPPKLLPHHIPSIPVSLPSTLLERRPDIAAAERTMQAQNALIGVATAGYFPDISLSAALQFAGRNAFPFTAAQDIWSLGAAASDPLFDGGLRAAEVDSAKAAYRQSVASYRQAVLTALGQVEDYLVALKVEARQSEVQEQSIKQAREAVDVYLNQYRAGTVPFTSVVVAEQTLLTSQESALTTRQNMFVASVNLIEALGGGWTKSDLPDAKKLTSQVSLLPRDEATK
ncbi:MAG: efflux transporter outer membrane subunit [Ancalomicrobiaceae bacterium]|nr:efflux transporter outer membrane subunit [Ancalomicrobiaceae bacterium]